MFHEKFAKIPKENIIKATAAQNKFLNYTLKLKNLLYNRFLLED